LDLAFTTGAGRLALAVAEVRALALLLVLASAKPGALRAMQATDNTINARKLFFNFLSTTITALSSQCEV